MKRTQKETNYEETLLTSEGFSTLNSFTIKSSPFQEPFAPQLKGKVPNKVVERMKSDAGVELSVKQFDLLLKGYAENMLETVIKEVGVDHKTAEELVKYYNLPTANPKKTIYWKFPNNSF